MKRRSKKKSVRFVDKKTRRVVAESHYPSKQAAEEDLHRMQNRLNPKYRPEV